jgi:hypothetical protein
VCDGAGRGPNYLPAPQLPPRQEVLLERGAGDNPQFIMLTLVLLVTIIGDFIEPVPTENRLTPTRDICSIFMK